MHTEDIMAKVNKTYSLAPFFELSSDLLCIAGFDGYFKKINPALCKLLGYSKQELLEKPINSFIHPDDKELTEKHRKNIRNSKPLLNFENRYISKDGKTIWLSWTSMPVYDQNLVYAIAKNITHIKKHESERNQLLSEVTKINQRLKQLNYTTAHDLRSPVNNLLAVFSMMDTGNIKDEETLEFIGFLKTATDSLKKTLDNYVDDLQSDKILQVQLEELELEEIFNKVTDSLTSLLKDANARFTMKFDAFKTVNFNQSYLESIFLNLITNSIKYAHPDRDPEININTQVVDGAKKLIFSDNGQGFDSKNNQDKVFGLYQSFHNHEDSKGIGLYLVYSHMTNLGGHISVDSVVNKGTTFTLTFRD
ncbi:MAG: PAS domain-containing sensor histidine kinase [Gracilimonas sp.]|nr:PAS domain-containing sensor histidine kinase [Gracilimonas sp.]